MPFQATCRGLVGSLLAVAWTPARAPGVKGLCLKLVHVIFSCNAWLLWQQVRVHAFPTACPCSHNPELTVRETLDFSARCQGMKTRMGESEPSVLVWGVSGHV